MHVIVYVPICGSAFSRLGRHRRSSLDGRKLALASPYDPAPLWSPLSCPVAARPLAVFVMESVSARSRQGFPVVLWRSGCNGFLPQRSRISGMISIINNNGKNNNER